VKKGIEVYTAYQFLLIFPLGMNTLGPIEKIKKGGQKAREELADCERSDILSYLFGHLEYITIPFQGGDNGGICKKSCGEIR
jgi:hypothetical protein